MKRYFAFFLALTMLCPLLACGKAPAEETPAPVIESTPQPMAQPIGADASAEGSIAVYAPEKRDGWQKLGELYTARSGIPVSLTDSAENADLLCVDYDTLASLAERMVSLAESAAYAKLLVPSYAYENSAGESVGLPLSLEAVAVAVNTELLEKAGYSMEDLDGFKALHRFSVSVNDRKDDLGFSSWAPMALAEGSGQKLTRYLFDMPAYIELQESGSFTGKYVDHQMLHRPELYFRTLFSTMLDLGTINGKAANSVSNEEALSAFARGEALFCLVDSRELDTLASLGMDADKLDFVPAWMGIPGEESLGFVADATAYAAIAATETRRQNNAEDFLYWCLTDGGARLILAELYDALPYTGFSCRNALLKKNAENDAAGLTAVPWLHRQLRDIEGWDSYFLAQLHYITPNNATWRWTVMISELVKRWNES